ncbi:MAG TPA: hypothetical protein VMF60_02550 [Acidimicrobiales bacterium]|nr:hypothetical protein [Acidimicrobiales bacterium]
MPDPRQARRAAYEAVLRGTRRHRTVVVDDGRGNVVRRDEVSP